MDPKADGAIVKWKKSSYSPSSDCVEVGSTPNVWLVRDTKNRNGGTLQADNREWAAFINFVKTNF